MGKLERSVKKRARKQNLQKIVLATVATAGLLTLAAVAPNAIQAFAKLGIIDTRSDRVKKSAINRARDRLIKAGLLSRTQKGFLELTQKGRARLHHLETHNYRLKIPRRWDNKWRVLVFDIPEKRRVLRDKIRNTLVTIGFFRIQDSVWAYPYDCEDLIAMLKTDFKIGENLLYLVVEEMEGDEEPRKYFGLPEV